jgi:predicted RNase H-like HicB family nuclease
MSNIKEATALLLESMTSHGHPIPEEVGVERIAVG